jgi:glycosyltransferase involved in cell wall biosynthesis
MHGCDAFRPVVIAPTYNNARTLRGVLDRVRALGLPVIVVNDGATDATGEVLAAWAAGVGEGVWVLAHAVNRGKAAALRTGFRAAAEMGYTHAATIDTDGQLDPEQIPALLALAERERHALVVGYRDDTADDYPARSRVGRRVSNLLVLMESGVRVQDSQCGLRVYPMGLVNTVECSAGRFGFETEIITRAGWAGCGIAESPVRCRYFPPGERVSHFRPWVDSLRGVGMHVRLLGRALTPWPHRRWPESRNVVEHKKSGHLWDGLVEWLNPARAWRQLRGGEFGRMELATGVAIGIFIANLPLYGVQTLLALYAARRLHLHPLPVVAGSQVSTPPVGVAMVVAAIYTGHVVLHGSPPSVSEFDVGRLGLMHVGGPLLAEWVVGALLVGLAMAVAGFVVTSALFRFVQPSSEPVVEAEAVAARA